MSFIIHYIHYINMSSLKIYQHHDFEFGLVFSQGDEETSVLYYPNNGVFSIPEFGLEYNSFSDVINNIDFEGEKNHLEELFTSYFEGYSNDEGDEEGEG